MIYALLPVQKLSSSPNVHPPVLQRVKSKTEITFVHRDVLTSVNVVTGRCMMVSDVSLYSNAPVFTIRSITHQTLSLSATATTAHALMAYGCARNSTVKEFVLQLATHTIGRLMGWSFPLWVYVSTFWLKTVSTIHSLFWWTTWRAGPLVQCPAPGTYMCFSMGQLSHSGEEGQFSLTETDWQISL